MKKIGVFLIIIVLCASLIGGFFLIFPIKYKDIILKYSSRYGVDSYIIASVINIESGYDKNAKSSAGAMGLMQLLPSTAEEIAHKLNMDFITNDLYIPEINVEFGCYYLSYLMNYFDGNIENVLSAYNWGINNVRNWISEGNIDTNGSIKNIPIKETRDYLKKYKLNKLVYKQIYI